MKQQLKFLIIGLFATLALSAQAAIIRTIDLTPIDGTSWATVATTEVKLDFGPGIGTGRVWFTNPVNGTPSVTQAPYSGNPYVTALDGGNTLVSEQEVLFDLTGTDSFFTLNIALDNGARFTPGSVLIIRSLDRSGDEAQYFTPGGSIGGFTGVVDSHPLPSVESGTVPLVQTGSFFSAEADGISLGRAFYLIVQTDQPTFVFGTIEQDRPFGEMAFSIAVPVLVPLPGTLWLVLIGTSLLGFAAVRQ